MCRKTLEVRIATERGECRSGGVWVLVGSEEVKAAGRAWGKAGMGRGRPRRVMEVVGGCQEV